MIMTSVTFIHSSKAFLPELHAYKKYLTNKNFSVSILYGLDKNTKIETDLCYRFGGVLWGDSTISVPQVHEFHTLSTGHFPRIKNYAKSKLACTPVARVFLSETVRSGFSFTKNLPYLIRDMGADASFFAQRSVSTKLYDVIYAGSISGRVGLLDCIELIASKGYKVGLAGSISDDDFIRIKGRPNIDYVGKLASEDVPIFVGSGRFGLNFCPDHYPYNLQTSTKVIEYLAAGVPIISNRYSWISQHSKINCYDFIDIDNLLNCEMLAIAEGDIISIESASKFDWNSILDSIDFVGFLEKCLTDYNNGSLLVR